MRNPASSEDVDPPKREFRFKAAEFERLNQPAGVRALPANSHEPSPLPPHDPAPVAPAPSVTPNPDVLALLQLNRARAELTEPLPVLSPWRKRQRRLWGYLLALLAVDGPCAAAAYYFGHNDPFLFVPLIGGAAYFTGLLTWKTWFLKV